MKKLVYAVILFAFLAPLAASSHQSIDIVASNWKFTPDAITVHLNEHTMLRLTSGGGVHGIASNELGIPKTMIVPMNYTTVTFTPKKLGTYEIHCAVMCGAGHFDMEIIVKVV